MNNASQNTKKKSFSFERSEKLKQSNKLNKKILNAKTLEAFTPRVKFAFIKCTYFKNMFSVNLSLKLARIKSARLEKKSLTLGDRLTQKMEDDFLKKRKMTNSNKILPKIVILISSESYLCL